MEVILLQDVKGVGKKGERVSVKDGYGQNFLIKQNLAAYPTAPEAKKISSQLQSVAAQQEQKIKKDRELAESLRGKTITIVSKAGEGQKLYGSVTKSDIADALKIDKNIINLEQPIRSLGTHTVRLDFGHGILSEVVVQVTPA